MFRAILLSVDLNQPTSWAQALPVARQIARDHGAALHIVAVVPDFGMPIVGQALPKGYEQKAVDATKKQLKTFADGGDLEGIDVHLHVAHGTIYKEILGAAEDLDVDLIVMASHRPELQDYLIGPNAARVVRHANCSVLVVRG